MDRPTSDLKSFYEGWAAERGASPLEQDYVRRADAWKWAELEVLIREHGGAPGSVLEFGCGSGDMLELASAAYPGAELWGIDLSEHMIAMASARVPTARLLTGGLQALESFDGRVDLVLAVDILEHLEDPVRAAKAMGRIGRRVALKIPLERRILRLALRRQLPGPEHHVAGHLHFWTLGESRALIGRAGLEILGERCADPPESIRYHPAAGGEGGSGAPGDSGWLGPVRRVHRALDVRLERLTCRANPTLHRWMFGSSHFVLARRVS